MRYNFPKKESRDKYADALRQYLKEGKSQEKLENLQKVLDEAIREINPSKKETDKLFNNMQFTALLALEAVFFKEIAHKDKDYEALDKDYRELHKKLYIDNQLFQDKLKQLKEQENYSVSKDDILANPSNERFDGNLEFQTAYNGLFQSTSGKKVITLPRADEKSAVVFLANIDPHFMAHIIVNQELKIKLERYKVIDILHEALVGIGVLCCTILDTGLLLVPPIALGASAFTFGGLSLPLTVGVSLLCLSTQLTCQTFDPMQISMIKNKMRANVDGKLSNPQTDIPLTPQQVYTPMQLFNIESILIETIKYIGCSYSKNKKYFQRTVPEVAESIDELMRGQYIEWQSDNKKIYTEDLETIKNHIRNINGDAIILPSP